MTICQIAGHFTSEWELGHMYALALLQDRLAEYVIPRRLQQDGVLELRRLMAVSSTPGEIENTIVRASVAIRDQ